MARQTRAQAEANSEVWGLIATLATATNPDATPYSLPVSPPTPLSANVLAGRQVFTATTAATTLITVPAGRTWQGVVGASASCAVTAGVATAGRATAEISVAGADVVPAAGVYLGVDALVGANAATGVAGNGGSNFASTPLTVIAPAGNAVTIQVATTNTGTVSRVDAFASGSLVAE